MRVAPPALAAHLGKGLASSYLLFGSEPLLLEEAADQIRQQVRSHGVAEVLRFTAGVDLDWSELIASARSQSLFANHQLIEVRLPTGKPGEMGSKALLDFLQHCGTDTTLVLLTGRIDKRAQATKWFKGIEKKGVVVEARSLSADQLPEWIQQRFRGLGISVTRGAVDQLAYYAEGNLMAAAQEIRKLAVLLDESAELDEERLEALTEDQARFSVYNLVDAALGTDAGRALRILTALRREGTEAVLVVWALAREARSMAAIAKALQSGESRSAVFRSHQVWRSREACVNLALKHHPGSYWSSLLGCLSGVDRVLKGRGTSAGDSWVELERVVLSVCGITTLSRIIS